jgi:glycosyltransferase involved in cell wall biosynthesis
MKICLIGPTHPFRGGISHYTTLLFRNLKQRHQTIFIAFKRQYPQFLYPGETDVDPSKYPIVEHGVVRLLDPMSPYSWLKVAQKVRSERPDLIILPWWTSFWTAPFFATLCLIKRQTSAKILFICHNVREHESTLFHKFCTNLVLKMGDFHFVHSEEDQANLQKIIPGSPTIIRGFHPTYENLRHRKYSRKEAREELGVTGNVILFFGFIRPYKGLKHLLKAMPAIIEGAGPNVICMIVGECWKDEAQYQKQIENLGIKKHIFRVNQYVPNEKVGLYFSAADLVVMPYISATGSGILQIAFGCEKPVVATRVGGMADDIIDGRTGYLVAPADPEALARAIVMFFNEKKSEYFEKNIKRMKDRFSWERMTDLITKQVEKTL